MINIAVQSTSKVKYTENDVLRNFRTETSSIGSSLTHLFGQVTVGWLWLGWGGSSKEAMHVLHCPQPSLGGEREACLWVPRKYSELCDVPPRV